MNNERKLRLCLESLEKRDTPAVKALDLTNGMLTIRTDDRATSLIAQPHGQEIRILDQSTHETWDYTGVKSVFFIGGKANDQFTSKLNSIPVTAYGNAGNDILQGGGANDMLFGGSGNDFLEGGAGNDTVVGGQGKDNLAGGRGDDILISLDGTGNDVVKGDQGKDTFWTDYSEVIGDRVSTETWQKISRFKNRADLTLDGDRITDPDTDNYSYKRFDNKPLFFDSKPLWTDISQGAVGDCWLLAGLSAIAKDSPQTLRENLVDFGDGTYGMRLGDNFYRVDNDLPVSSGENLAFAKLGQGDAMWVAIAEKGFAFYRTGENNYSSLIGGWMNEVNQAFRFQTTGAVWFSDLTGTAELARILKTRFEGKESVTVAFLDFEQGKENTELPIIERHAYTVAELFKNSAGIITGVKLRNPWGVDGAGDDGKNDGFVSINLEDILRYEGQIQWGKA